MASLHSSSDSAASATSLLKNILNIKPTSQSDMEKDEVGENSQGIAVSSPSISERNSNGTSHSLGHTPTDDFTNSHSLNGVLQAGQNGGSQALPTATTPHQSSEHSIESSDLSFNESGAMAMLLAKMNRATTEQKIVLTGDDTKNSFSVYGQTVHIETANMSSRPFGASNKIKTRTVVRYDWDNQYYIGNLVAIHRGGIFLAYSLKAKTGDILRVLNRRTADRVLIRGFTGRILDISFAHVLNPAIIAAVDEYGVTLVHEVEMTNNKLEARILAHLSTDVKVSTLYHRVVWCPYIPDDQDNSGTTAATTDSSSVSGATETSDRMLFVTHDNKGVIWNVDTIHRDYGASPVSFNDVSYGCQMLQEPNGSFLDAAFSPDGLALAASTTNGDVKFYNFNLTNNTQPSCIHEWRPHEGNAVSCLAFLDDYKNVNSDAQFWKYAITGCHYNSTLKIWSCESWKCLQTVTLNLPAASLDAHKPSNLYLKCCVDLSAKYVMLSDIKRSILYILQVHQDNKACRAHICGISEFALAQPCLSMCVLDARRQRFQLSELGSNDIDDLASGDVANDEGKDVSEQEQGPDIGVAIKMYSIHPKLLQELKIRYRPECSVSLTAPPSVASSSQDAMRDLLSDVSTDVLTSDVDTSAHLSMLSGGGTPLRPQHPTRIPEVHHSSSPGSPKVLMTPDAFTSSPSPRKSEATSSSGAAGMSASGVGTTVGVADSTTTSVSNHSSLTHVTQMDTGTGVDDIAAALQQTLVQADSSSVSLTPPTASSRDASGSHTEDNRHAADASIREDEHAAIVSHLTDQHHNHPRIQSINVSSEDIVAGNAGVSSNDDMSDYHTPHDISATDTIESLSSSILHASADLQSPSYPIVPPTLTSSPARPPATSTPPSHGPPPPAMRDGEMRGTLHSDGSSSSASLEVSEILEAATKRNERGDALQEEESIDADGEEEEEDISEGEESTEDDIVEDQEKTVWPEPPLVQGTAHQLATEAIASATASLHGDRSINVDDGAGDEDDDGAEVVVEEDDEDEEEEEQQALQPAAPTTTVTTTAADVAVEAEGGVNIDVIGAVGATGVSSASPPSNQAIQDMSRSLQQMISMLEIQQNTVETMRTELSSQQETIAHLLGLETKVDHMRDAISLKVKDTMRRQSQTQQEKLSQLLTETAALNEAKQNQLVGSLKQTVDHVITQRIDHTINQHMTISVVPMVRNLLEPLRSQLHKELQQKLTATDTVVKESVSKLLHSKQMLDYLSTAVSRTIQGPVTAAIRDFAVPGFDRACQNLNHQLSTTFTNGTQQYTQKLESHLNSLRQQQASARDPYMDELRQITEECRKQTEIAQQAVARFTDVDQMLKTQKQALNNNIDQAVARSEKRLSTVLSKAIKSEVSSAMQKQQATLSDSVLMAMRESGALTPAVGGEASGQGTPHHTPDPQQQQAQILLLLREGQYDHAFTQALSASDLQVLMTACEVVNPDDLFATQPCLLKQPTILSLIQQLSAELSGNTQLKIRYLEELMTNLDLSNNVTKEHVGVVIGGLYSQLEAFMSQNPRHALIRQLRVLLMASKSLIK